MVAHRSLVFEWDVVSRPGVTNESLPSGESEEDEDERVLTMATAESAVRKAKVGTPSEVGS